MLRIIRNHLRSSFDPAWFSPRRLAETWVREGMETRFKRFLTVLIVLLLCTNAVSLPMATYLDSVGIDAFLSLLELQVIVGLALLVLPATRLVWRWIPWRWRVIWIRQIRRFRAGRNWLFSRD